ncbi:phage minor capsid protein [Sphaerisporangium sp. NPDC004334]
MDGFSPADLALKHARLVADMYADAEAELFRVVRDALLRREGEPDYAGARFAEVRQLRKEAEQIVRRLEKLAAQAAQDGVTEAWQAGVDAALADLRRVGSRSGINPGQGVTELAAQVLSIVTSVHQGALRAVDDMFRRVIAEVAGRPLVGAETRRQAEQRALDRFAAAGITGFVDSAGRTWDMVSYTEMAMRSAVARAAVDGHLATLRDGGQDLVMVSRAARSCPVCDPWEGKILSQSGPAGNRTETNRVTGEPIMVHVAATVARARAEGLLHPNCRHGLTPYLPGATKPLPPLQVPGDYRDTQRQRYLERRIRAAKRQQAAALDEPARKRATAKLADYQAQLAEHVKQTGLRRDSRRESVR